MLKKNVRFPAATLLVLVFLTGCSSFAAPASTPIAPTALLPTPAFTPLQDNPSIGVNMFDEKNGWGSTAEAADMPRRILRTSDGGLTWKDVTPAGTASSNDDSTFFLDAQNAWFIPATHSANVATIYRTGDGGQHWSESQNLPFKLPASVNFVDANNGWAADDLGHGAGNVYFKLYQTSDGGKSWRQLRFSDPRGIPAEKGLPAGAFHTMSGQGFEFRSPATIWFGGNMLVAETAITLMVSRNAGKDWIQKQISVPESDKVIFDMVTYRLPVFITDQDAYILASYALPGSSKDTPRDVNALIITHDGGRTWAASPALLDGTDWQLHLQFISATDAFVHCGETLCVTHDGAQTWQRIPSNVSFAAVGPDKDEVLSSFDFVDATTGWAEIAHGDKTELIKTTDGGLSWTKLFPIISP